MSRFDFSSTESEPRFSFQQGSEDNTGGNDYPPRLKEYDQWLITYNRPWHPERL